MINIDSRLLSQLDANEYYLICYLANMTNKDNTCWPGNKKMCADLKWSMVKLQATKRKLSEKGLIQIEIRQKENGPGQTSNYYRLLTPLVSNYTPSLKISTGGVSKLDIPPGTELDTAPVLKPDHPPVSKLGNEVLTNEVLTTEALINEALINEKLISHDKIFLFKKLIDVLYPHLSNNSYVSTCVYGRDTTETETELESEQDPTTRSLLKKIWGAAQKIYSSFDALKKPLPAYREFGMFRRDGEISVSREAEDQIQAYADFCRLTKTYLTTDPDKLPEKLLQADWCDKLMKWATDQIEADKYDPATDDDLCSQWLLESFYTVIIAYECNRYNNRIMYGNEEYLNSKK